MSDSALVTRWIPAYSGNYTRNRARQGGKISEITIHHAAGIVSIDGLGELWQRVGRKGSSHYGVAGSEVGQYVAECDVAWTNSDWPANCRAVTIEVSNSGGAPNWPISDASLQTLVQLVADIAKRNGLHPLVLGKNLTWHSMYTATACPGPYLYSRLQQICDEANNINKEEDLMEFLEVFGQKNCQCFTSPDVDAVDTGYNGGTLKSGDCYPVMADAGIGADGYHWYKVYAGGATRYAVLLDDRCRVVALSAGDAVKAVLAQAGDAGDAAELSQLKAEAAELAEKVSSLTARATTAEAKAEQAQGIADGYLARIKAAQAALAG